MVPARVARRADGSGAFVTHGPSKGRFESRPENAHSGHAQRLSATSSASMSSAVEMTLLLAWNPR
jgi:hypothetical protein